MSCFKIFVARKYKVRAFAAVAEAAATKMQLAKMQAAAIGFPARMKRIQIPRRRLAVKFFHEKPMILEMRHVGQNLGSVVSAIPPVLNQRLQ